jgi:hypothetical protein
MSEVSKQLWGPAKNMKKQLKEQSGQAMVTLLFVAVVGITIISSAAIFVFQNIQAASVTEQGVDAYYIAEAGVEEGLLRTIRNASYSGTLAGHPLLIGSGSVVIQATPASGLITAIGSYNNSVRKIQVQTVYNNGVLTVSSWKEVQ